MKTTNDQRETRSDELNNPLIWYVYIMENTDNSLYIGQTNDLVVRVAEHAMGAGADATSGQSPRLVWFTHTHSRENASNVEKRLKRAYNKTPEKIRKVISDFNQLVKMVRPEKTLKQLQEEETAYNLEMGSRFHYVSAAWMIQNTPAACGWDGGPNRQLFGTSDWDQLAKKAETYEAVLAVAGKDVARRAVHGRLPCGECLARKPVAAMTQQENV